MKDPTVGYSLWSLVLKNKGNFAWGAFWLLVTDVVVFSLPQLVKQTIDRFQDKPLSSWVPEYFVNLSDNDFIIWIGLIYLGLSIIVSVGRYFWRHFFVLSVVPLIYRVRERFFNHVQNLDRNFFKNHKVGDLISALSTDTQDMRMAISMGGLMAVDIVVYFLIFPFLLWQLDSVLTLMTVPFLIGASLLALYLTRNLRDHYNTQQEITADLSGRAYEISSGVRILKAFRKEKQILKDFVAASEDLRDASVKVAKYESGFVPGLQFALGIAMFAALLVGGFRVLNGQLDLSSLVAFQIYLAYLDWPMMAMGWIVQLYRQGEAASRRVRRMGTARAHFQTAPVGDRKAGSEALYELEAVSFQHEDQAEPLFKDLNLKIEPGKWVGITGPVASGKSTFLELLSRQRDPTSGRVVFGGRDLRSFDRNDVARQIVYTPQETFLFSRSIRQNLQLGLSRRYTDEELWKLLSDLRFPLETLKTRGGLETKLGERGVNLSGGQKQRLSLGRALLRDRDVYILDDLFSHLDADTELELTKVLHRRLGDEASVLLVSQRLETLLSCEDLLVFGEEGIEFYGPVEDGLKESPFLQELQRIQRKEAV